jgi:hypothetical protein
VLDGQDHKLIETSLRLLRGLLDSLHLRFAVEPDIVIWSYRHAATVRLHSARVKRKEERILFILFSEF